MDLLGVTFFAQPQILLCQNFELGVVLQPQAYSYSCAGHTGYLCLTPAVNALCKQLQITVIANNAS